MIEQHDLDGHGGHLPSCRQCRLDKAIYALERASPSRDRFVQVPVLGETGKTGGTRWASTAELAAELKSPASALTNQPCGHDATDRNILDGTCLRCSLPSGSTGPADAGSHEPIRALIADWRERARLARVLESAPLTAEKRKRTAEWMHYTNRANELESALAASASAHRADAGSHDTKDEAKSGQNSLQNGPPVCDFCEVNPRAFGRMCADCFEVGTPTEYASRAERHEYHHGCTIDPAEWRQREIKKNEGYLTFKRNRHQRPLPLLPQHPER